MRGRVVMDTVSLNIEKPSWLEAELATCPLLLSFRRGPVL